MKKILLAALLLSLSCSAFSQVLRGRITNQAGEPIQYSTVYIQEIRQGTTANTKGDYELRLKPGTYSVTYQSLGFEPVTASIAIAAGTITKNVSLPVQYYTFPEVRITASGEDPAYIIMRKVIGMAPYYLNNISYYKAEVYLKGNLILNRIPKIIQKQMKIEARSSSGELINSQQIKAGDVYMMESFNEMEFTAPDKYSQKVISFRSTFPDQGDEISPMDFIEASFYQPVLADIAVSPLSPQAFSYYRFRYLGASTQGEFTINKIAVIPKRKSQQVFEGTIYIIEDLWCLHSVDLTNENLVGKVAVQQLYVPVQNNIWMPVSHKFRVDIDIMGFKAEAGYGGSVKYIDVKPNLTLRKPETITTNYTGKVVKQPARPDSVISKNQSQISKILEKDEITNRDMARLSRLMEKESEKSRADSAKKSLEIKDNTTRTIEKDAAKKDSAFWATIRPIPLSEAEIRSVQISDSIRSMSVKGDQKPDTLKKSGKASEKKFVKNLKDLAFGRSWSDTTGFRFTFGGLADTKYFTFNTVDGFRYGVDFRLSKNMKKGRSLTIAPDLHWAFARRSLLWNVSATYRFDRLKQRQVFVSGGVTSTDFNEQAGGINRLLNSVSSLFFERNYLKLYESRNINAGYSTEITNGLNASFRATYEDRRVLDNNSSFSIFDSDREYTPNSPVNSYLDQSGNPLYGISDMEHYRFTTQLTYTPQQRYRLRNGSKIPAGSDWPTFTFSWTHILNKFPELTSQSREGDRFRFEASKRKDIGAFGEFRWSIRAGGYIDKSHIPFYDFFHFNTQPLPLLISEYHDAFMLPAYYSLSSPGMFVESHVKYTTPYLLLKLLPGLSNTLMRENLSFSFLKAGSKAAYTEIGYSISEFLFLGEIGIYAGFDNLRFNSLGGKVVLKFD